MEKQISDSSAEGSAEVRLELSRAGIEQVLSVYANRREEQRSEFALDDIWLALKVRRFWLICGTLSGLLVAVAIVYFSTPLYPISARVLVERTDADGSLRPAGSAFVATQAQLMRSHDVLLRALSRADGTVDSQASPALLNDTLRAVKSSPISGTDVIALSYLGPDAEFGARLLEQIVLSYRDSLVDARRREIESLATTKAAEVQVLLEERAALEARIADLRDRNGIIGSAADAAAEQGERLDLHLKQLTEVRNRRITLENRLAAGGDQLAILDPATRSLQESLWEAESELSRLRLNLTPEHPTVLAAERNVQVLTQQLRSSGTATPQALERDLVATRGLEAELRSIEAQQRRRLSEIETHRLEEDVLLGERGRLEELIAMRRRELLDQRLQAKLNSGAGVDARLISRPTPPSAPAWPKPGLTAAVGTVLGFGIALVFATLSTRRQRRNWELAQ